LGASITDLSKAKYRILVTPASIKPDVESDALAALRGFAGELVFNLTGKPLSGKGLVDLLAGCDGVVAGLDAYDEEAIKACAHARSDAANGAGRLKAISRYGVGYDNIDLASARRYGVAVTNTPGANAQSVADLAIGLMLCAARRLPALDRRTKSGEWPRSVGVELYGKTIGIIGLGAVGKGVAKRAQGFSMNVLAYDVAPDPDYLLSNGIRAASFGEIILESDFISLHAPLNDSTRHMLNRRTLSAVKPGAIIINTARGGLIDEAAAYEMLVGGRLGGLGLDVYEDEPPGESPLFGLDNVIATPHTASHTAEATRNMADMAVKNLIDVLSGNPCPYVIP
jgi:D-3-phosphoglycerate dehydrogenase